MWRLLCLLLAFVAPAQAAIHRDGFEARMPVSDWVSLEAKDGVVGNAVAVNVVGGYQHLSIAGFGGTPFDVADFPTTPNQITGIEIRVSAISSHPGVSISGVGFSSEWGQLSGSLGISQLYWLSPVTSSQFNVGDSGDVGSEDFIAAGGYAHITSEDVAVDAGPVSASPRRLTIPAFWHTTTSRNAVGEPGSPYVRTSDSAIIEFQSAEGYNATLYIDSIQIRLHYNDASTTSMSGSGTMSATLLKAKSMASAMSGSGACAATLNSKRNIYSAMRGSGKITPVISRDSGGTIYRYLMPEMIGTGEVTLTQPIRYGTIMANMVGSGDVVASISHGKNIMAPSRNGTLALRGSGTLAETLRAKRPIATAMAGSGAVSGGPLAKRPIATAMTGTGAVSASMIASRPIATAMTGSGVMSETLRAGRVHPGVAMTGSGAMTLALLAKRPLVAAMQGTGLLSADLTINTRLPAPDGRTFIVPESDATFIAPDDFIAFEVAE